MRTVKKLLGLLVLLLLLWERGPDGRVLAAVTGDSPASDRFFQARKEDGVFGEMEDLGIQEEAQAIEDYLRQSLGRGQEDFSFISLMKYLLAGKLSEAALEAGKGLKNSLWGEIEAGGGLLLQVVLIGMVGAVFSSFASIFQGGQVSETGFFVTYLLLFACLAASFFASLQIAAQVRDQVFGFLQVLMPAYFMAWPLPEEVCPQLPSMRQCWRRLQQFNGSAGEFCCRWCASMCFWCWLDMSPGRKH